MPAEAGRSRQSRLRISGGGLNSAGFPTWRCNRRAEMHRAMASRMDPSPTVWTAPPFLGGRRGFETFCSGSLAAAHACSWDGAQFSPGFVATGRERYCAPAVYARGSMDDGLCAVRMRRFVPRGGFCLRQLMKKPVRCASAVPGCQNAVEPEIVFLAARLFLVAGLWKIAGWTGVVKNGG